MFYCKETTPGRSQHFPFLASNQFWCFIWFLSVLFLNMDMSSLYLSLKVWQQGHNKSLIVIRNSLWFYTLCVSSIRWHFFTCPPRFWCSALLLQLWALTYACLQQLACCPCKCNIASMCFCWKFNETDHSETSKEMKVIFKLTNVFYYSLGIWSEVSCGVILKIFLSPKSSRLIYFPHYPFCWSLWKLIHVRLSRKNIFTHKRAIFCTKIRFWKTIVKQSW